MSDNDSDSDSSFATSPTFWKERLSNPKAAMDEYVTMYSSCFLPATSLYIYGSGPRVAAKQRVTRQCEERLAQRETRLVRAGAVRKQVDDMLEYALRLETGTHVLFDPDAALRLFKKVLDGPYPNETRAIAAMCSCYCLKRAMAIAVELFDPLEAFTFLNRGCELGL
ncbi:hypothetical protein BDZ97DRAFT_1440258 [Flammula alnicola]|nr:hypothetical protein BDZ97DRAFT_1440258 [Flammula alnicola]